MNKEQKKAKELVDKYYLLNPIRFQGGKRNLTIPIISALIDIQNTINALQSIPDIEVVGNILLDKIAECKRVKEEITKL